MKPATTERAAFRCLTASLGLVTFNLLAAQVLFGIASLLWLKLALSDQERPALPPFGWPLVAYLALTVASAVGSIDPVASFIDLKQLVLFLMVPMVMRLARGDRAMLALNVVIAVGAAAALLGVVEYAIFGFDNLDNRPLGSLTHYMTYSGVIMLVLCAAVARLLYYPAEIIWPAVAVPALAVALVVTQTRGAWIGAMAGIGALVAAKRLRLLLIVPVLAGLAFILAPAAIQSRVYSIADPNDPSNRDRVQMIGMGADMVRDHPWLGVGPEMVGRVYAQYLRPDPVHTYNPHLHNVPVQIAAERGVPALLAWIAFVGVAAFGLFRQLGRGPAPALAGAGLAAVVSMLAAGVFEYNFGDSEFLMLFLGLVTLPFAARQQAEPPRPGSASARVA